MSKSNESCESYDFFSKIKLNCYFSILFLESRDLTRTKSKYYQIWHFLILLGAVDHQINVLRNCTALNDYFRYISKMAATKQWKWGLFQSKPEVWNNTIWLKDKKNLRYLYSIIMHNFIKNEWNLNELWPFAIFQKSTQILFCVVICL